MFQFLFLRLLLSFEHVLVRLVSAVEFAASNLATASIYVQACSYISVGKEIWVAKQILQRESIYRAFVAHKNLHL